MVMLDQVILSGKEVRGRWNTLLERRKYSLNMAKEDPVLLFPKALQTWSTSAGEQDIKFRHEIETTELGQEAIDNR